jgi:hypothetical protein
VFCDMVSPLSMTDKIVFSSVHGQLPTLVLMQDDSYLESYISTIGVDFVSILTCTPLC